MQHLTFKYRLNPNQVQHELLMRHAGTQRFVWNKMLEQNISRYEKEKKFVFYNEMHTLTKDMKYEEFTWMQDILAQTIQASCRRLDQQIRRSFSKRSDKLGFPKFRSKKLDTSLTYRKK